MTAAEQFLYNKLNPPKVQEPLAVEEEAFSQPPERLMSDVGILKNPLFSCHRVFWGIGFALLIILVDVIILSSTEFFEFIGDFPGHSSDFTALSFSLVSSITFWLPAMLLLAWIASRKVFIRCAWCVAGWLVVSQIAKTATIFCMRGIHDERLVIGIVLALIGSLPIYSLIRFLLSQRSGAKWSLGFKLFRRRTREYRAKYTCDNCKKTVSVTSMEIAGPYICPNCFSTEDVYSLSTKMKEPVVMQIVRALCYIFGILAIITFVANLCMGKFGGFAQLLVPALYLSMASSIKEGRNWPRIVLAVIGSIFVVSMLFTRMYGVSAVMFVMFGLPGMLMFLPRCNSWFAIKRYVRKHPRTV